ncbi:hypothetical protein RGR602_PB00381 (plasmid) [Rhizobium gallicum bv. gallicum R602sp]|uniref:Uncharacterized protein n=1 Tax=Rhizobium gallicum bv. gallicum R602sp TaxID=1041138 RepID=A0A0B4XBI9_9HYPH|nr:hypothetical protein RGR602_PB00381 [Rhizobium gallicum bv. gallicum R602sp]
MSAFVMGCYQSDYNTSQAAVMTPSVACFTTTAGVHVSFGHTGVRAAPMRLIPTLAEFDSRDSVFRQIMIQHGERRFRHGNSVGNSDGLYGG